MCCKFTVNCNFKEWHRNKLNWKRKHIANTDLTMVGKFSNLCEIETLSKARTLYFLYNLASDRTKTGDFPVCKTIVNTLKYRMGNNKQMCCTEMLHYNCIFLILRHSLQWNLTTKLPEEIRYMVYVHAQWCVSSFKQTHSQNNKYAFLQLSRSIPLTTVFFLLHFCYIYYVPWDLSIQKCSRAFSDSPRISSKDWISVFLLLLQQILKKTNINN